MITRDLDMKNVAPITEKKLRTVTKHTACGVVPGLYVWVTLLKSGELAKYFVLRERSINRTFTLGKYPDMSLAEAFKKAAEWKEKIKQGVDPSKEEKERRNALRREQKGGSDAPDVLTFERLIRQWINFNEKRGRWSTTV